MVSARTRLEKKCRFIARIAIAEATAILREEGTPSNDAGLGSYLLPRRQTTAICGEPADARTRLERLEALLNGRI